MRLVGSALSFFGAMALFNRLFLFLYLIVLERNFLPRLVRGYQHSFILGGLISFVCYLIILQAYQHLPVALVSSLRETSILFAILLGALFLREKMTIDKAALVLCFSSRYCFSISTIKHKKTGAQFLCTPVYVNQFYFFGSVFPS